MGGFFLFHPLVKRQRMYYFLEVVKIFCELVCLWVLLNFEKGVVAAPLRSESCLGLCFLSANLLSKKNFFSFGFIQI